MLFNEGSESAASVESTASVLRASHTSDLTSSFQNTIDDTTYSILDPLPPDDVRNPDDLDAYAEALLMRCDVLLQTYQEELKAPAQMNFGILTEKAHVEMKHSYIEESRPINPDQGWNTSGSDSGIEVKIESDTSHMESHLMINHLHGAVTEPMVPCDNMNQANAFIETPPGEDLEDLTSTGEGADAVVAVDDDALSEESEEAFLYLSPASSVSIPYGCGARINGSPMDAHSTAPVTKSMNLAGEENVVVSTSPQSRLEMEDVSPFLYDEVVSSLWKRLVEVRSKRLELSSAELV